MCVQSARVACVYPGSRVITSHGDVATVVAFAVDGSVLAIGPRDRAPRRVVVCGDAWGGEHDQAMGMPVGLAA